MRLELKRIPGEDRRELVFYQQVGELHLWVKNEYEGAPWEWILYEGRDPVAFGDARDQETAERYLSEAVREHCPDFEEPTIPKIGLLRRLWRSL